MAARPALLPLLALALHLASSLPTQAEPQDGTPLARKIAAARSGATVRLPAGTFEMESVDLPTGVSVKGDGYDKTTLVINGQHGLRVMDGRRCTLSDLTVRGAVRAGIAIEGGSDIEVRRVRILGGAIGVHAVSSRRVRLENVVTAGCRTGVVLNRVQGSAVVNCSLVRSDSVGLSLSGTERCAAFNNLFASSPIGVFVATDNRELLLDHNVYYTNFVGKGKDVPMPSVFSWRDMSGHDAHSVSLAVRFEDEEHFRFKPASTLEWALDRAVTAGWGVEKLGTFTAPPRDVDDQPRRQGFCAGAYEADFKPSRPADGIFEIRRDDGIKSAGLYDREGRNVRFLFSSLPLHQGRYSYWLPSRGWKGDPIPAGSYELRLTEANLAMKYVASPGNTAVSTARDDYASTGVQMVVFDSKDRPILCHNWSEGYKQYRAMDARLEHERWSIPGCASCYGAASDGKGTLHALVDGGGDIVSLVMVDEETGKVKERSDGAANRFFPKAKLSSRITGLAFLDGKLYLADGPGGRMLVADVREPKFERSFAVPAPSSPVADPQRGLLWVLSNRRKVLALDPSGAIKHEFAPNVSGAYSLAVRGDRMAVLGIGSGKVHLFDCSDPAHVKATGSIGKGDHRWGPLEPDRFLFQDDPSATPGGAQVALNARGDVAVVDQGVKLFGADGKARRQFTGIWGQYVEAGASEPGEPLQLIEKMLRQTYRLDEKTGTWKGEATWKLPPDIGTEFWHFFLKDGKRYGVHLGGQPMTLLLARYESFVGTPLIAYRHGDKGQLVYCDEFAADTGKAKGWKPLRDEAGQPVPNCFDVLIPRGNGDLVFAGSRSTLVPFKEIDGRGVPRHDWSRRKLILLRAGKDGSYTSPYDAKVTEDIGSFVKYADWFSDGTFAATVSLKSDPGSGFANWGGTDLAGFDASGKLLWLQPLPHIPDIQGTKVCDDVFYSVAMATSEIQILDKDGMLLGVTGVPRQLFWDGMWLDNIHQYTVLKGNTGKHYVVFGNFNDCTTWWMEVMGRDTILRHRQPVEVNAGRAAALAERKPPAPPRKPQPPAAQVKIRRLAEPLAIDGSLAKWRNAVPTPQIILTPETGHEITGPTDCSALVRLAYEGKNLYVQVIRFDDVIALHQPLSKFYQQDAVEMALNSYVAGIKVNVTRVQDRGEVVYRDGWFLPAKLLSAARAPRKVTVLDDARDVQERKLIEQVYGVDLSQSSVIITEFKVALDRDTFEGREGEMPRVAPGASLRLGIRIDDNDAPGSDSGRKDLVWPATYNTFSGKPSSGIAVFE